MTDIVEFIKARLDEDEAIADAAVRFDYGVTNWCDEGDHVNRHIARHDPARVLREVAAKRALLDAHCTDPKYGGTECLGCHANFQEEYWTQDINKCPTLRAIASVYSDHQDYDPTWSQS